MKDRTISNNGCDFYFPGPRSPYMGGKCEKMERKACYIFNGGICCSSECPGAL